MSLNDLTITIHAGPHDRRDCPIRFTLQEPLPEGIWELVGENEERLPLQPLEETAVAALLPELPAGTVRTYRLQQSFHTERSLPMVRLLQESGSGLRIDLRNRLLTRYVYESVPARPYFYPVMASMRVCLRAPTSIL
jgi:hypothetical protein